jgi:ABC-type lipoprotein release transport system permease subunit
VTQALLVVGGLFILVYAPLAVLAWRRPLLARFAFRESVRRRGQFALLVVGLLAGSAAITASLVAADTGLQSQASALQLRLGAVDLTVTGSGGSSFPADVAQRLSADQSLTRYVDGVQAGLEMPASVGDVDRRLGRSAVLVVGFDPAQEPRFGAFTLTDGRHSYGDDLATGDVIISRDLASDLEAQAGDRLQVSSGSSVTSVALRVYGIATSSGPGAYGSAVAMYMPLATARLLRGDSDINVIRIAARGGSANDLEPGHRATAPLRTALAQIPGGDSLLVNELRVDTAQQLEGTATWLLGTTLGFAGLVALAAIALVVNLVLALAEERRPLLAVLRAMGLTRAGLIAMAALEGAIYSLAAATAGVAVGVIAGLYMGGVMYDANHNDPLEQAGALQGAHLELTVRLGTLAVAFAVGALITLGTFTAAAYRTSKVAIASAVRDLPEPASPLPNRWPLTALLLGLAALGGAGLVTSDLRLRLIGGVTLIVALTALVRGRVPDRLRATLAGLLVTAWAAVAVAEDRSSSDIAFMEVFFIAVAITAIGLSLVMAANLKLLESSLGLLGNRFGSVQATLRPPLAYLSRRPMRTGLATGAFGMVLVVVTVVAIFVGGQDREYARDSGGFDLRVVASGPEPIQLPPEVEPHVLSRVVLPMRLYHGPFQAPAFADTGAAANVMFYVLPESSESAPPAYLVNKEKRFATDAATWQAVRSEVGLVVLYGGTGAQPGSEATVQGVKGLLHLRVAGSQPGSIVPGIIASQQTLAEIQTQPAGSTVLLKTGPGADPRSLARQIERSLFSQGVQATSTREILDQDYASGVQYGTEYDVLLHMGLVVGVLALAMLGIRTAVERRRAIGILRSLGYQPPRVVAGLVVEAMLTATVGVATGVGAGVLIGYFMIVADISPGTVFAVDLGRLGLALVIVYATTLLVTGPVASRLARLAPTEAIRMRA